VKKGLWFEPVFVTVVLVLFIMAAMQLIKEKKDVDLAIGQLQSDVLKQDREMQLLTPYVSSMAKLSVSYGVSSWAADGMKHDDGCGRYGGYSLWQVNKDLKICFPKSIPALAEHISDYSTDYVQALPYDKIEYEVSIIGKEVIGVPLGKLYSPPRDKQKIIQMLPEEEAECISKGLLPDVNYGRFFGCVKCLACRHQPMRYCVLDPCGQGCAWQGGECVDGKDVQASFYPAFEELLGFETDGFDEYLDTVREFSSKVSLCNGDIDSCIDRELTRLKGSGESSNIYRAEECETEEETIFYESVGRMQECLASLENCYCSLELPDMKMTVEPGEGKSIVSGFVDDEVKFVQELDHELPEFEGEGNTVYMYEEEDAIMIGDAAPALEECMLEDRTRRFCSWLGVEELAYDPLTESTTKEKVAIKFALFIPRNDPPPPLENLEVFDQQRSDKKLLVMWDKSPSENVEMYKVYVAEESFEGIPTSTLAGKELVWKTELTVEGMEEVEAGLKEPLSCRFKEIGKPCSYELNDGSKLEAETGKLFLFPGDRMGVVIAVEEDDVEYHVGATALDKWGNEIDNVAERMPIMTGTSTDGLPPGLGSIVNGPILESGNSYSFTLRMPTENADGSELGEEELSATLLYGTSCPGTNPVWTGSSVSGGILGAVISLPGAEGYCFSLLVSDGQGNPDLGWEEYGLFLS